MIWVYTILLATALYYLGSRTKITHWLHSRYPEPLYNFMACPMCSPVWFTLGIVIAALKLGYEYPGFIDQRHALVVVPLCALVLTPLLVALVEVSMHRLSSLWGYEHDTPPEVVPENTP